MPDGISTAVVVARLNIARQLVEEASPENGLALCKRIALRKHWILCVQALCGNTDDLLESPSFTDAAFHLNVCRRIWAVLRPGGDGHVLPLQEAALQAARPHLWCLFDITLSRPLSTHIPLRPMSPADVTDVWAWWEHVFADHVSLATRCMSSDRATHWQALLAHAALDFQRSALIPFVRSVVSVRVQL